MAANKKNITIDYNGGTPIFNPVPGSTSLDKDDWVMLQTSRFPNSDNQITGVSFYHSKSENGKDKKDTSRPAGAWTRSGGPSNLSVFTVGLSGNNVKITDEEDTANDDKYWFSVTIGGTGAPPDGWSLDPELINKKRP